MKKSVVWTIAAVVAAGLIAAFVGLFAEIARFNDPYANYVREIDTFLKTWKVSNVSPRNSPETEIHDFPTHSYVSAIVTYDRAGIPSRLPGASGTITRRVNYRREKGPSWRWNELIDRILRRPIPRRAAYYYQENPKIPDSLNDVKSRIGRDSPANLVQDLGIIYDLFGSQRSDASHDVLLLRAELELEAGAKHLVVKDLEKIRFMQLNLKPANQKRAEALRIATGETGSSFLKAKFVAPGTSR